MGFLQRILGPRNSLILTYDHFTQDAVDEFEVQLDEVASHYEWAALPDLVTGQKVQTGKACVVFTSARRSLFTFGLPRLRERQIPFTVFTRTDFVGVNQLPAEDELGLCSREDAAKFALQFSLELEELQARAWQDTAFAEKVRREWRVFHGGLPIDKADPLYFSATWGQVIDAGAAALGLIPSHGSLSPSQIGAELDFIRKRTGAPVEILALPYAPVVPIPFSALGIRAVLQGRYGIVDSATSPFDLPRYRLAVDAAK